MASNWIIYDSAKAGRAIIGPGGSPKLTLHALAYAPNRSTQAVYADLTAELPTAYGYTSGGIALTAVTFATNSSSGVATFSCNNVSLRPSGGNIGPFRTAVIRDTASSGQPLICYSILDTVDILVLNTQSFTIQINASGILAISGAIS